MQCQDNSKLRTPLEEVCLTTDIGCVPIVRGKPDCSPQPDELPLALDPDSTTLWLFSCRTRTWVPFKKFSLLELEELNLDDVENICNIVDVAIRYNAGNGVLQGVIPLGDLARRMLECLTLQTRTIVIDPSIVKVWIDGLPTLPPFFVKGKNIWFEGGEGTENDPFIVATYDPICEWPNKTQDDVDRSTNKQLGACLDGEMVRVPYPKLPCEYPALSQPQVDSSTNKQLLACVDGDEVKVPYIEAERPLCDLPVYEQTQVMNAGIGATMAVCVNGQSVRMPIPSGMFVPEYLCVPKVSDIPVNSPGWGTGPFRVGCNEELYVWLCEERKWERVSFNPYTFATFNAKEISQPCENVRILAFWGPDECPKKVHLSICELKELLDQCEEECNSKRTRALVQECVEKRVASEEAKTLREYAEDCRESITEENKS